MADWASSVSLVMASHSAGSRLELMMGGFAAVAFDDDFVEVVRLGGVEGFDREVVDDEQVNGGDPAHLGFE